ncbi:MAG: hypothetical protein AAF719_09055 [Pseudomonadota bacterium]
MRFAASKLVSPFESAGFGRVEREFEGALPQINTISLEHSAADDCVDFVKIIFDKYRNGNFKVISGTRKRSQLHKWKIRADLVCYQSDLDRAKWGGEFVEPQPKTAIKAAVAKVVGLSPQGVEYLDSKTPSPNVYVWPVS